MKVVFVCVENSNRSQMAEAFGRLAGMEAYSAGSKPSGNVNPKAIASMQEVGYDMRGPISEFASWRGSHLAGPLGSTICLRVW